MGKFPELTNDELFDVLLCGKRAAYNEILRKLHETIKYADIDWKNVHCREENNT